MGMAYSESSSKADVVSDLEAVGSGGGRQGEGEELDDGRGLHFGTWNLEEEEK